MTFTDPCIQPYLQGLCYVCILLCLQDAVRGVIDRFQQSWQGFAGLALVGALQQRRALVLPSRGDLSRLTGFAGPVGAPLSRSHTTNVKTSRDETKRLHESGANPFARAAQRW